MCLNVDRREEDDEDHGAPGEASFHIRSILSPTPSQLNNKLYTGFLTTLTGHLVDCLCMYTRTFEWPLCHDHEHLDGNWCIFSTCTPVVSSGLYATIMSIWMEIERPTTLRAAQFIETSRMMKIVDPMAANKSSAFLRSSVNY